MRTVSSPRSRIAAGLLAASALLAATAAQAHAKLVSSDPAANAAGAAPKSITLMFSEEIAKKLSSLKLADTDGNALSLRPIETPDGKTLSASPASALAAGLYTVSWTAVATDDGHKTSGSYSFSVQ